VESAEEKPQEDEEKIPAAVGAAQAESEDEVSEDA
jgi:hypothetical protein